MGNRSMTILEQLSASDAQVILDRLPERIRMALLDDLRSVVDHRAGGGEYIWSLGR
jgi:hypothetical protein